MFSWLLCKIIGTKQERDIKKLIPYVTKINSLESKYANFTDAQLRECTDKFKEALRGSATLNDILFDAFAVVREAAKRTLRLRHFDVQVMGGVVLHQGKIAQMKTGEGKTLVATMPLYLHALTGKNVHLVTVNDYLAKRDRYWMGPIYEFLGLTVGFLQQGMDQQKRKEVYNCDIVYGTNNEFGFDYLRDNMVVDINSKVQRGHYYAIIDEVDSILIDEARTPLIISGPAQESAQTYYKVDRLVPFFKRDVDFDVDEKVKSVALTERGVVKAERLLHVKNLYDPMNIELVHHLHQALRAYHLYKRDVDYVVKEGQVVIVDEFTGRLMPGRRFSDGLHQALEAKEGLRIKEENQTLATITYQNYFRMYELLAGMTGTAETEAEEFLKIYNLDVVVIPTDKPMIREDFPDVIYKTEKAKFNAIVKEIEESYNKGRPVLVGTTSIEKSERLSHMLHQRGIPHQVLNAKHHEREAQIIARAGQKKSVTIATNMAGRGTDIILGEGVKELGGLHVIGTERHEARRIDDQLRGRSGRQGDAGSSRFYLSLEDDLMRLFGSERVSKIMERLGYSDDQVIEHPWITKSIERAQKQVEIHNFDIRKRLLQYDDVMNQQRSIVYQERDYILSTQDLTDHLKEFFKEVIENILQRAFGNTHQQSTEQSHLHLKKLIKQIFQIECEFTDHDETKIKDQILNEVDKVYQSLEIIYSKEIMNKILRGIMLSALDSFWKDHLYNLDHLREGINLRAYGQRDPIVEYKHESFALFENMIRSVKEYVVMSVFRLQPKSEPIKHVPHLIHAEKNPTAKSKISHKIEDNLKKYNRGKIGRNQPCPCGSGKKYKYCCLH